LIPPIEILEGDAARLAQPEEVADVALFLASDKSRFVVAPSSGSTAG